MPCFINGILIALQRKSSYGLISITALLLVINLEPEPWLPINYVSYKSISQVLPTWD